MTPAPLSDTRPHGAPTGKVGSRGPQLIYLVITNGLSAECTSTDAIPFASLDSAVAYAEEQIRDWGQNSRYEGAIARGHVALGGDWLIRTVRCGRRKTAGRSRRALQRSHARPLPNPHPALVPRAVPRRPPPADAAAGAIARALRAVRGHGADVGRTLQRVALRPGIVGRPDRKSTRLNSSHHSISYA